MLEFRQLRQFVVLAQELNYRRAAIKLHMSQPPLSVSIQQLERTVGTALLERSRQHVKLTAAGAVFYKDAVKILSQTLHAVERAQRAADGMVGTLRLSFVPSATLDLLPDLLKKFQLEYPTVQLNLSGDVTGRQIKALRRGDTDLAIVVPPLQDPKDLVVSLLREEKFVLAIPDDHPLAQRKSVRIKELASERFISFPSNEGPGFVSALLGACQNAGFLPKVVQEAGQMQTILTLVSGGVGIALVPAAMKTIRMRNVAFVDVTDGKMPLKYTLVFAYQATCDNPVVDAFLSVARRVFKLPK